MKLFQKTSLIQWVVLCFGLVWNVSTTLAQTNDIIQISVDCLQNYSDQLRDLHTQQLLKIEDYKKTGRHHLITGKGTAVTVGSRLDNELIQELEQVRKLLIGEGALVKDLIDRATLLMNHFDPVEAIKWQADLAKYDYKKYCEIRTPIFESIQAWGEWYEVYLEKYPSEEMEMSETQQKILEIYQGTTQVAPLTENDPRLKPYFAHFAFAKFKHEPKLPTQIDHRNEFPAIEYQGGIEGITFPMCLPFAVNSVLEQKLGVDFSERQVYSTLTDQDPTAQFMWRTSVSVGFSLEKLKAEGIAQESDCPWDPLQFSPVQRSVEKKCSGGKKAYPQGYSILFSKNIHNNNDPDFDSKILRRLKFDHVIEALVYQHRFPIASIVFSSAREMRDWIQYEPATQNPSGHVLVIVGYGSEISPFTMREEPYFLLRDSSTQRGVHLKISKKAFYQVLDELVTIDSIKIQ